MSLAAPPPLPSESVPLSDGSSITVRALTYAEATREHAPGEHMPDWLAAATGATREEAAAWLAGAPFPDARALTSAVLRLSGLDDASGEA